MIELRNHDGQVEGWHIRSAFEAMIIGRAAVLNDPNEATTLYLHHNGVRDPARTEVEFLERDIRYGRLVVNKSVARNAEEAFRSVVSSGEAWNNIQPEVARAFVDMLDASREAQDTQPLMQVPESEEPISVTSRVPRAA